MPILKRRVNSSPNFVSLLNFMKNNSSVLFSSNNIYFTQKEHIKMKIFKTFKCSGQNSSNSSCQFRNDKSIPLKILHHSSLSWHITPLWILSSNFSYFRLKDPINIPILRLSNVLVKFFCIFYLCIFLGQTLNTLHIFYCNNFEHFWV